MPRPTAVVSGNQRLPAARLGTGTVSRPISLSHDERIRDSTAHRAACQNERGLDAELPFFEPNHRGCP